ncbi:MAG: ComEC/Rec2 family competence protein [Candidatus Ratteibacteria bacterium]|nr:ComEC/Rec2 family competence protein [Candidatus Ratteibacteria bacterium]
MSYSILLILSGLITGISLTLSNIHWYIIYIFFSVPFLLFLKYKKAYLFSLGVLIGFITAYVHTQIPSHHLIYPSNYIEKAEGTIISSRQSTFSTEYIVNVKDIVVEGKQQNVSGKILLKVKDREHIYHLPGSHLIMEHLTLHRIPPPVNPVGFDYRRYLEQKGIYLQGEAANLSIKIQKNYLLFFNTLRKNIIRRFRSALLYFPEEKEMIEMLILGQEKVPQFLKQAGIRSGTYHLLVISGLHIGFILLFLRVLFIPFAELNNRHPKVFPSLALIILWFYAGLTSFKVPVVRAVLMYSLFFVGEIFERDMDIITSIMAAAFLLLIINPYNLFDASFQLSFLATLGIILFWQRFKLLERNYLKTTILTSLAAQIAVLPVLLYHFGYFYPMGLVNNIFFVPLTGVIVIVSFVSFIVPLLFPVLRVLSTVFVRGLTISASISPPVCIRFSIPLSIAFYSLCLLLLYSPRRRSITTSLSLLLVLSIPFHFVLQPKHLPDNSEILYLLSLTKPSAVYIKGSQAICFLPDHYKTTELEDIVIPLLSEYRVRALTLFYTTVSYNHTATLNILKKRFNIKKVYEAEDAVKKTFVFPYLEIYYYKTTPSVFEFLPEGKKITIAGTDIEILGEENSTLSYIIGKGKNSLLIAPFIGPALAEKLSGKELSTAYIGDIKTTKKTMEPLKSLKYNYLIIPRQYKKFGVLTEKAADNESKIFYLQRATVKIIPEKDRHCISYYWE